MKKLTMVIAGMSALCGVVAKGGDASAADYSNHAGAMCRPVGTGNATVTSRGYAENASTTEATLICPMVRDMDAMGDGTFSGNVWVVDNHYSEDVCCSSRVAGGSNGSFWTSSSECTNGSGGVSKLGFSTPTVNYSFYHRYYYCTVPGVYEGNRSSIYTYRGQG
jgi:hypothetical protein